MTDPNGKIFRIPLKRPGLDGDTVTAEDVTLPPVEYDLIQKIVQRGADLARRFEVKSNFSNQRIVIEPIVSQADITLCHKFYCPLNLWQLLLAGDTDFAHDFFGINQFWDRKALALTLGFKPRFAKDNTLLF
jgi:hypothetical protein